MWRCLLVLALVGCGRGSDHTQRAALATSPEAITWLAPIEVARGGGEKGLWQQNDSLFDYVDDGTVAFAEDGRALIAWVDHRHKDVFVARDGSPPINVSQTPAVFSWLPRLAVSGSDVFVVWQEIVFSGGTHGGDIFFARSRDGGRSFERALDLSESIHGDGKGRITKERWHNGSLDIALAADGTIYIAWTAFEGQLWLRRSRDRGQTFERAIVVDDGTQAPARAPSLAIGDAVYLAWTTGENDAADVRVARSPDGVTFGKPTIVERTPHYSDAPKLAFVDGVLHAVISETSGDAFARPTVRYTRSRDRGATFEPTHVISGREGGGFPSLVVDGSHVVVAWDRFADDTPRGLALAHSLDGGTTFSAPAPIPGTLDRGTNGSQQGKLASKLAMRGDAIAVATSALRHGESSRVWVVRGRLAR